MRVFLDECVPEPLSRLLERLVEPEHEVASVASVNWGGQERRFADS